jgi:L-amino acid N-acyltransferase YncA
MKVRLLAAEDKDSVEKIFNLYWDDSFRQNLSEKLTAFISGAEEMKMQDFHFVVAEENDEILGVAAYRKCPDNMRQFTETDNPAEFYVAAVKNKGKGVGTLLMNEKIQTLKQKGYTEIIFFSGETHKDSWGFHDASSFERVGKMSAPNGEVGNVWRLIL